MTETFESIQKWGHDTFGVPTVRRNVGRAYEEFEELFVVDNDEDARIEAADVVITLLNMPGIIEAINSKMLINRARQWNVMGDGTGYHVKEQND